MAAQVTQISMASAVAEFSEINTSKVTDQTLLIYTAVGGNRRHGHQLIRWLLYDPDMALGGSSGLDTTMASSGSTGHPHKYGFAGSMALDKNMVLGV